MELLEFCFLPGCQPDSCIVGYGYPLPPDRIGGVTVVHSHRQSQPVINRLKRIEGHVRAVKEMAEDGKPCSDILLQIAAVQAALHKVGTTVLQEHLDRCVLAGEDGEARERLAELRTALAYFCR